MLYDKLKENLNTEFKSSFNDEVIETLVAFANTNGGKVLVGVDNKGMPIKKFMIGDETVQQWINEIKTKTQPSLIPDSTIIDRVGGKVVELSVKEFPVRPVSFRGRYYNMIVHRFICIMAILPLRYMLAEMQNDRVSKFNPE